MGDRTPGPARGRRPILVVTAAAVEREAAGRHLGAIRRAPTESPQPGESPTLEVWTADTPAGRVDLVAGGVGAAAAAAVTATLLCGQDYGLAISAGIGGAFDPVGVGDTVVASAVVAADLGAEDGADFLSLAALGLGQERTGLDPGLVAELARRTGGHVGAVLSVSTVTGSEATARRHRTRHPDARAEAMEGAGVLAAARLHGVAVAEVRTASNLVGPRDRAAWDVAAALDALATAIRDVVSAPLTVASARRMAPQ